MLRFFSGEPSRRYDRRQWLAISSLACLGCLGPALRPRRLAAAPTAQPPGFGRARSVLLVYTSGGQSQLETWDPKPHAPDGIRGQFEPTATSVPGTFIGEHLPQMARLADRYAIIRSLAHDDLDHGSATYLALTGRQHPRKSSNPPPAATDEPSLGAVLKRVRPNARFPYDAIHINGPAQVPRVIAPGQDGGFLGRSYEPLVLGDVSSEPIAIGGLERLPDLSKNRLVARQSLRGQLEAAAADAERDRESLDMDNLYRHAFELLSSPATRKAFDLSAEKPETRDRYGRHRPGQACLLGRRLIEAGVPLVNVIWNHTNRGQDDDPTATDLYGWDTHNDIFDALKTHLLPRFDQTMSTLLADLEERGLLETTLVVCFGEFGRAPRIALEPGFAGRTPGRKHWAGVYSAVVAGAGVQGGLVYGASDPLAAHPVDRRIGPWDLAATIFAALGIDPAGHYLDPLGRPLPISVGKPVLGLYSG